MSISMERFGSEGQFATYRPASLHSSRVVIFQLQCRSCGYEPEGAVTAPRICPKCHGETWERYPRPGSILDNAERH
jgi:hypothetical protein